MMMTNSSL
uniref:Uncharacterized protein n=1 Tax=Romanomermis culicivorax TaxID=13658 RepID=A0A915KMJ1_ROMCU